MFHLLNMAVAYVRTVKIRLKWKYQSEGMGDKFPYSQLVVLLTLLPVTEGQADVSQC